MRVAEHDPGGRSKFPLKSGVQGRAAFSPCGRYRHWLMREWGSCLVGDGDESYALWIGMNPSTAEAELDDPTIRRELAYTDAMGISRYYKVNVMDYRATYPNDLLGPGIVPASEGNLRQIESLAGGAKVIIAAWGALPKQLRVHADATVGALRDMTFMCMGTTKDGSPRHPLYLPKSAKMVVWRRSA